VALLHGLTYFTVTRLTLLRPASVFIDPSVALDGRIPHLAWTWPAYWLPYLLVPAAAVAVLGRLEPERFARLIGAWSGMILIGGAIQVAWPAVAPWPRSPAVTQRLYHDSALILPYATLPSMHVAHVMLAALVAGSVFPATLIRVSGLFAVLIAAAATLTLKEHYVLDATAGMALAQLTWTWWRLQ
jgi:hypothetical protein